MFEKTFLLAVFAVWIKGQEILRVNIADKRLILALISKKCKIISVTQLSE